MLHTKIIEPFDDRKRGDTFPLEKEFLISSILDLILELVCSIPKNN